MSRCPCALNTVTATDGSSEHAKSSAMMQDALEVCCAMAVAIWKGLGDLRTLQRTWNCFRAHGGLVGHRRTCGREDLEDLGDLSKDLGHLWLAETAHRLDTVDDRSCAQVHAVATRTLPPSHKAALAVQRLGRAAAELSRGALRHGRTQTALAKQARTK